MANIANYLDSDSDNDSDSSDSSDKDEQDWVDEENKLLILCGMAVKGIILSYKLTNTRMSCRTSSRTGSMFINEVLNGHPRRFYEDFRLHIPVFKSLCFDLSMHYGLKPSRNLSIEESVGIFLMTLAHGCGNRLIQETFNRSGETIHRHFHKVLKAVLKFSRDIIRPSVAYNEEVPAHILTNSRYYPTFKVLHIYYSLFDFMKCYCMKEHMIQKCHCIQY